MAITIELSSTELANEDLQKLTRQLCAALRDTPKSEAVLVTTPGATGAKGDLPAWGQIAIASISVVSAAVTVIGGYLQRSKSVTVKFHPDNGKVIEVSGTNMDEEKLNQLFAKAFESEP